ncbi:DUF4347 domain-containing protein [Azospirillum sp. ST 5-10]|uniref:DUF4347 domain-containing protein n=1 Tax=unclassified Azospirillum TaxID=2630922 RepID=UPI003F4A159B
MRELLIADSALEDLAYLLERRRPGVRTILVSADEDAHGVLARALAARPAAIHLLAHGEPGRVRLGAAAIDAASLADRHWPSAPGTEILIHACRVAEGETGRRFVERLARATDTAVAAASTPVGDAAQGAGWSLDHATATITAASPFVGHEAWPHVLAVAGTPSGGADTLIGDADNDVVDALAGDDYVDGGGGNDVLSGNQGNDYLYGGDGDDSIDGGDTSDTIDGGAGADFMTGGPDYTAFDRVTYASAGTQGVVLDLENPANSQGFAAGDTIVRINLIEGSEGNDLFIDRTTLAEGETGDSYFWGHGGDDTLSGAVGRDTLEGGYGNDWIDGGSEDDQLYGHWDNDVLLGNHGDDKLFGGDGDDLLVGHIGNDSVFGGLGADTVFAGEDNDEIFGNKDADALYGNQGADTIFGGQDADSLFGGQDSDLLYGQLASDVVYGQLGVDTLFGGQGDDTLFGGQGDDLLFGNVGNDTIVGNLGNDTMEGNDGADTFVFGPLSGADTITDFSGAEGDRLQVAAGTTWTIADGDAGAVVVFSTGDQVTLTGVRAVDISDSWFTTG